MYFFNCRTPKGEIYTFGLVPGRDLQVTSELFIKPMAVWSVESYVLDQISGLDLTCLDRGTVWDHTQRMRVLFSREHARQAFAFAQNAASKDDRFDKKKILENFSAHQVVSSGKETGLVTKIVSYTYLVGLAEQPGSPEPKNLARYVHQSK